MNPSIDMNKKVYMNSQGLCRHIYKNNFYRSEKGDVVFVMNFASCPNHEVLVIYHEVDDIQAVRAEPIELFSDFSFPDSFRFMRIGSLKDRELISDVKMDSEQLCT